MESLIESGAPSEKLQKCSHGIDTSGVDRISNLPESIICYILSLLPTDSAVGTSILSKSWRYLWTKVNTIDLDDWLLFTKGWSFKEDVRRMSFVELVNKVFIQNESATLGKFHLIWHPYWCHPGYANTWITEAVARNVKVVDLNVGYPASMCRDDRGGYHHLPDTLFTCKTLEFLSLKGPFLFKIPSLICLPKLSVLQLTMVDYEKGCDDSFSKFISSCPVLDSLSLFRHYPDNLIDWVISSRSLRFVCLEFIEHKYLRNVKDETLKIHAPALERLILKGQVSTNFSFDGLSSLIEVELKHHDLVFNMDPWNPNASEVEENNHRCNLVVKQIDGLNCAKLLKLGNETSCALIYATVRVSARFERLTDLCIYCKCCNWSFLMDLLDCSMKLKVLRITEGSSCDEKHEVWRKPSKVPACLLHSLVQVSFNRFYGLNNEFNLVSYILKHGAVLKGLNLDFENVLDFKEKSLILEKLSMFPRTSPSCRIKTS